MPDRPYLVQGDVAQPLEWRDGKLLLSSSGEGVDSVLTGLGLETLGERTAQVAYGANRDLRNLAWKMIAYARAQQASSVTVVLPGSLQDSDVVACNLGYWGYIYSSLIQHRPPLLDRPYLKGSSVQAAILLLDNQQVAAMHASEGVPATAGEQRASLSCDVATTHCEVACVGAQITAQTYVLALPYLSLDGGSRPVGMAAVAKRGAEAFPRLSEVDLWERIAEALQIPDFRSVVSGLRSAALSRALGDPGVNPEVQQAYERIRLSLADDFPLVDPDGVARDGIDGCSTLLSYEDAWAGLPTLGSQGVNLG